MVERVLRRTTATRRDDASSSSRHWRLQSICASKSRTHCR